MKQKLLIVCVAALHPSQGSAVAQCCTEGPQVQTSPASLHFVLEQEH